MAVVSHRQAVPMWEMIRPGELEVGRRWESVGIIDIKTPRKTVGRLKYEIDQRGLRPTAPTSGWSRERAYCKGRRSAAAG